VPGRRLDFVSIAGHDAKDLGISRRQESGFGWANLYSLATPGKGTFVNRRLQRQSQLSQLSNRNQTVLRSKPRIRGDARIGRFQRLAVVQIVVAIHAIQEQHPGLGMVVRRAHHLLPQLARANLAIHPHSIAALVRPCFLHVVGGLGLVHQLEVIALFDRAHERIGHAD
jgi:hypothetical protein